jgi:hypothetical protein
MPIKFSPGRPLGTRSVPYSEFLRLVRAVASARSEDPTRRAQCFTVLSWAAGPLALVATDGHRAHAGYPSPVLVEALAVPKGAELTFDAAFVERLPLKPPADGMLSLTLFELPVSVEFPAYHRVMDPTTETEDGVTFGANAAYLVDVATAQKVLQVGHTTVTPPRDAHGQISFRMYDGAERGRLVFHAVVMPVRR